MAIIRVPLDFLNLPPENWADFDAFALPPPPGPASLLANMQFFRPTATARKGRFESLLSMLKKPYSVKRTNAGAHS